MPDWTHAATVAVQPNDVTMVVMVGGMVFAIIAIVGSYVTKIVRVRSFEASRREISAYVAEGTISAEDATKLLAAGAPKAE